MSGFVMLAALVLATAAILWCKHRAARRREAAREAELAAQLDVVARAAAEDVGLFAEELQVVQGEVERASVDASAARAHHLARRACVEAQAALRSASHPAEIARVTRALAEGRYALAYAVALVRGRPRPARRTPCFFNPAHGPSSCEVAWTTPDGHQLVPACSADADRLREGAAPNIRLVPVGVERLPYWQAGPAFEPYAEGYLSA